MEVIESEYEKGNFNIIWANEINAAACGTYRKNIGEYIIEGDIRETIRTLPAAAR